MVIAGTLDVASSLRIFSRSVSPCIHRSCFSRSIMTAFLRIPVCVSFQRHIFRFALCGGTFSPFLHGRIVVPFTAHIQVLDWNTHLASISQLPYLLFRAHRLWETRWTSKASSSSEQSLNFEAPSNIHFFSCFYLYGVRVTSASLCLWNSVETQALVFVSGKYCSEDFIDFQCIYFPFPHFSSWARNKNTLHFLWSQIFYKWRFRQSRPSRLLQMRKRSV